MEEQAPRVVIQVMGGIVTGILADHPLEVLIALYDTDKTDSEAILEDPTGRPAILHRWLVNAQNLRPDSIRAFFSRLGSRDGKEFD